MILLRTLPLAVAAVLLAAILRAAASADIFESFAAVVADPWGLVGIVDLYAALALLAVLVWVLEPRRPVALAVILASPVLGSLAPALWLAWRLPSLVERRAGG